MSRTVTIERATDADLAAIVAILAADDVGGHGDTTAPEALPAYRRAFAAILADPRIGFFVARRDGEVVGTLQLVLVPCLAERGTTRAVLETVQVRPDVRSGGIGAALVRHAVDAARAAGAGMVELTSNKRRLDAHRFYERLGFARSHEGFKLPL